MMLDLLCVYTDRVEMRARSPCPPFLQRRSGNEVDGLINLLKMSNMKFVLPSCTGLMDADFHHTVHDHSGSKEIWFPFVSHSRRRDNKPNL